MTVMTGSGLARTSSDLEEKVLSGERLTFEDGVALFRYPDLAVLGRWADEARRRRHGNSACFIHNMNLNPTNICVLDCKFCAFFRRKGDRDAYAHSMEEMEERIARGVQKGVREVHIVGGLNPEMELDFFEAFFRRISEKFPALHIKAFTAVEMDFFARVAKTTVEDVIGRLKAAGLGSMPGGGAEIFSPRVREVICTHKINGERWLAVMREAHRLGVRTNATILYGHMETPEERVEHLLALRDLQDETGGFQALVPLAFHPPHTKLSHLPSPSEALTLRVYAVSRLLLDNIPHLRLLWMYTGKELACRALCFGADDLGGTNFDEEIIHAAGAQTPTGFSKKDLVALIRSAGLEPAEVDSLYRPVTDVNDVTSNL